MNLILDSATEQRIQREVDLGHYRDPAEVVARAVSLLEAEENWLHRNKKAINQRLEESMAQARRGEVYTEKEVRGLLKKDRKARASHVR